VKEVLEHALRLKGLTDEQIERHLQFLSEQPCVLTAPPGEQSGLVAHIAATGGASLCVRMKS
jgi:hypothetical protein